jgi:outer membrane receptor protein involved in Fe transport
LDYIVKAEDLQPEGRLEWTNRYGIPQTVGQTLVLPQFDSPYDPMNDIRTPTPWISHPDNVKNVFETGLTATHALSLEGAGRTAGFRLSLGNQYMRGIVPNTDLKKNNVTFSGSLNVLPGFTIGVSASYINNRCDNVMSGGYSSVNILQSLGMWFGRQVDTKILREKWNTTDPKTGKPFNWIHYAHDNPYFTLNKHLNTRNRSRFMGNVNLEYRIVPSLSISAVIGNDWYTEKRKEVRAMGSVIIDNNTDWTRGRFDSYLYSVNEFTARGQLNFNKTFGDLNLLTTGGAEFNRYGLFADATHVNALIVPDLYSVSNAAVPATSDMQEENRELQGVFGMVNLGFKNYLYLDLTARNDWSSTLPPHNNSYFYPSASIGFILSEVLDIPTDILSFAKFRASYADVGGSAAAYQLKGKFSSFDFFRGNPALTYTDTRPPENLKPQHKRSIEFGTDMRFASNRFGFDLTWYKENTINQIMHIDIPGTTGFNRQTINAGNLQNQGWELTLRATPVRTSSFKWDIAFNWAKNVNTVLDLHEGIDRCWARIWSGSMQKFIIPMNPQRFVTTSNIPADRL